MTKINEVNMTHLLTEVYDTSTLEPGDTFQVTTIREDVRFNSVFGTKGCKVYVGDCLTYLSKETDFSSVTNESFVVLKFLESREQKIISIDKCFFEVVACKGNIAAPSWYLKKIL